MSTASSSSLVQLARLIWMMFGPMGLTVTALGVAGNADSGWRTTADIVYLILLAVTILARWFEFVSGSGTTGTGEPLTRGGMVRHTVLMAGVGLAVCVCANLIANGVY